MLRKYSRAAGKGIRTRPMTHAELEAWCLDYLNIGARRYAFPTHGPKHRPEVPGVADIIVCDNGAFSAVEIKVGKDKQSDDQYEFEVNIEFADGRYFVVRTPDDLIAAFPRTGGTPRKQEKRSASSATARRERAATATGTTPAGPRDTKKPSAGSRSQLGSRAEPTA